MNDFQRVEELTLKLLDDAISEKELEELEILIEQDQKMRKLHIDLIEQESALRGMREELDLSKKIMQRIRELRTNEPGWEWFLGKRFWGYATAAVVLVFLVMGVQALWLAYQTADPQETFLYGRSMLTPGESSPQRVFVRNAVSQKPLSGAEVKLAVYNPQGDRVFEAQGRSDKYGFAYFEPKLSADHEEGSYTLKVEALSNKGTDEIERSLTLSRSFKILVSTDKPLYQPGQLIHIRTLALATADNLPMAERQIVIEIEDGKGNKVFKRKLKTSAYGIAAADFQLAEQVNLGQYKISATMGDTTSERTVNVKRYSLPKFRIDLVSQRGFYAPGENVKGHVSAQYTFQKPVAKAKVVLTASEFVEEWKVFSKLEGRTDAAGIFRYDIPLKSYFAGSDLKNGDALISLEVTVLDQAGHGQKKTQEIIVSNQPIRVELFPESKELVQNVENILYILTSYPDGRPAQTKLTLGKTAKEIETSSAGIARVKITPTSQMLKLTIEAQDAKGAKVKIAKQLEVNQSLAGLLLRVDKAVYQAGDSLPVELHAPSHTGTVFVDLVKDRRTLLTKSLELTNGKAAFAFDLAADLFGTLEIHAYYIKPDGNMVSDARIIQVNRADQLKIESKLDKASYRPGEKANLHLAVSDPTGKPTPAALGLAGVDEAVFALFEMRPGLERVYFNIQEELLKPRYEIHAQLSLTALDSLRPKEEITPELEEATVVLFSQGEGTSPPEQHVGLSFEDKDFRIRDAKSRQYAKITAAASLILVLLFLVLVLPLFVYAIYRLFKPIVLDVEEYDKQAIKSLLRRIYFWFACVLYSPLVGIALSILTLKRSIQEEGAVVLAVSLGFLALVKLSQWVIRFRRLPASQSIPVLKKIISGLPVALAFAGGAVVSLIYVSSNHSRIISDFVISNMFFIIIGILVLIIGVLSASLTAVVQKTSVGRWLWIVFNRTLTVLAPLFVIFLFAVPQSAEFAVPQSAEDVRVKGENTGSIPPLYFKTILRDQKSPKAPSRIRRYFPETLLWIPELITDQKGEAKVEIPLADSITTWRIAMSAVSANGHLGAWQLPLRVFQDFFVDIDFPTTLTQHDKINVPLAIYNYLKEPQTIKIEVQRKPWYKLHGPTKKTIRLAAGEVTSLPLVIEALWPGQHILQIKALGTKMSDAVERSVRVEPDGKQIVKTIAGRLEQNLRHTIQFPKEAIRGANDLFVKIYPGSFSQVVEGLDNIFRMPYGCFEQTSSTTYPNVLVLNYMRTTKQIKPELEMKALNFINLGYQRLVSYEVDGGGFEWFGKAPAHTVLTAYGLMEFSDMAKVYAVDPQLIARTRAWLYSQQNHDGSWDSPDTNRQTDGMKTTAYITWALAEASDDDSYKAQLDRALNYIAQHATSVQDSYTLALAANALLAGGHQDANKILNLLASKKIKEGKLVHWSSTSSGVTHSQGKVLDIETTAISAYAFLKAKTNISLAHKALAWLVTQKDQFGNWHSTQATVHSFRALLLGSNAAGAEIKDKMLVTVTANGKVAKELKITPDNFDVFHLISLRPLIKPGENLVALEVAGQGELAYQIVAEHYLPWQKKEVLAAHKPISIDVKYDQTTLKKNDILQVEVKVSYNQPGTAAMTIVDLGIPPGFELVPGTFESLVEHSVIERFSITGRQVILYIREIPNKKPLAFIYQLKAKYPVKVKTKATKVYQYYQPEIKDASLPIKLKVL
jgi:uncharacterized protein YfaS (alpha-2-macroglobulin family)